MPKVVNIILAISDEFWDGASDAFGDGAKIHHFLI